MNQAEPKSLIQPAILVKRTSTMDNEPNLDKRRRTDIDCFVGD
jgi:hypothetical protein